MSRRHVSAANRYWDNGQKCGFTLLLGLFTKRLIIVDNPRLTAWSPAREVPLSVTAIIVGSGTPYPTNRVGMVYLQLDIGKSVISHPWPVFLDRSTDGHPPADTGFHDRIGYFPYRFHGACYL